MYICAVLNTETSMRAWTQEYSAKNDLKMGIAQLVDTDKTVNLTHRSRGLPLVHRYVKACLLISITCTIFAVNIDVLEAIP